MTTQADALRMAEYFQKEGDESIDPVEISPDTLKRAAAMLREYAEGMEVTDAMVLRALRAHRVPEPLAHGGRLAGKSFAAMKSALTAALSGREEGK